MSYLNNNTIVVDSILTKRGRELMAQGKLKVTKFALADDEVNYSLYNLTHPSGSDYYAEAIEGLPVLEAFPDGTKSMKYKLITLPKGSSIVPIVSVAATSISLGYNAQHIITPSTINNLNSTLGYTATLSDSTYVKLVVNEPVGIRSVEVAKTVEEESKLGISLVGKSFKLIGKQLPSTITSATAQLTISGNETGGLVTINITITNDAVYAAELD